jgi:hypothetical protein
MLRLWLGRLLPAQLSSHAVSVWMAQGELVLNWTTSFYLQKC